MSQLMDALREDPSAVFQIEAELPTGNVLVGTVGPAIGGKVMARLGFRNGPATDRDMALAKQVMDQLMGMSAALAIESKGWEEYEAAQAAVRRFMGGGMG